jgi:SAM-dependent methyltransferase
MFPNYQVLDGPNFPEGQHRNRPTLPRIKEYRIEDYLGPEQRVLDIGCNSGLFGVCLSPKIKSYLGVDFTPDRIREAQVNAAGLSNCSFVCERFETWDTREEFDLILLLAVHGYMEMPMEVLAWKLVQLLSPRGFLVIEGHPPGYLEEPGKFLNPLRAALERKLFALHAFEVNDRDLIRPLLHYGTRIEGNTRGYARLRKDGLVDKVFWPELAPSCVPEREHPWHFHWRQEQEIYGVLKSAGFDRMPVLVGADEAQRKLTFTFTGQRLTRQNLPADWEGQVHEISEKLTAAKVSHGDVYAKNLVVLDGRVSVLDFCMASYCVNHTPVNDFVGAVRKEFGLPDPK